MTGSKASYGIDAPGVVRNLLLAGGIGLALAAAGGIVGSPLAVTIPLGGAKLVFPLARMGLWAGSGCTAMGIWMLWTSRVGKLRERERLLDRIAWKGSERVLDVGCGRGLMLIGAAKRLSKGGRATGIDLWQAEDLSGNRPEATLENARIEKVEDRVDVKTADMREIPFPDGTFDVVLSCAAIHNLYDAKDRAKAVAEIARVLAPGGTAVIDDIRHGREYARAFASNGCAVRRLSSPIGSALLALVTFGSLRPTLLWARKGEG
jgi:arsenite methyltransferase